MKYLKGVLMVLGGAFIIMMFINAVQTKRIDKNVDDVVKKVVDSILSNKSKDYNVYALDIPKGINFAGEIVPVSDPDIYERMDRELLVNTYWQSNGLLLIKRAHKYFPIIEPILKQYGVPDDFKYLAVIESGLQNVISPAGATGFWQIMKNTGKEYGLEINDYVDERYHLEKSTEAACKYLLNAKEKFGTWTLTAASYNAGQTGIAKQMDRQKANDYYSLLLGEETGRYVFRILAVKEILSNPNKYGFNYDDSHLYDYVPSHKVEVDTAVTNFADFSKKFGINYKVLKIHNPWLRDTYLRNYSGKKYQIEIPDDGYYQFEE
ncbi:lytic transglycosylase domain-containing protein [Abyssalbus ytuae]|uniref:Lytic transglycosylase domain-containing protein n=1 Tax=Abyssalbus ytuae TaxID=2926907 RepID=A0A9E7D3V2_9FLAO|nr:lytic transglycosylase domain-containing protein [Abyssalbus ytuae]UOB18234.1 lytic transglycosylase domain-containing protein [Abyssalbus ytuae]